VYSTLDRLERDGQVVKGGADDQGHVFYEITTAGREAVRMWLHSTLEPAPARDELAEKIALVTTLSGADASRMVDEQRAASEAVLTALKAAQRRSDDALDAADLAGILARDARVFQAEAEVRWLAHVAETLRRAPEGARRPVSLAATPPRRGRPARSALAGGPETTVAV
jgi:DNA-binding PadR family transcriptional regulator